jgi:hypothetical protein
MSKQLQVDVEEQELAEIEAAARSPEMTLSEKFAVIRAAVQHDFPTADIDQMLAEVASGYGAVSE